MTINKIKHSHNLPRYNFPLTFYFGIGLTLKAEPMGLIKIRTIKSKTTPRKKEKQKVDPTLEPIDFGF